MYDSIRSFSQRGFDLLKYSYIYPPITYYWTVPLTLDHSYLLGKLTSSNFKYCWYKSVKILDVLKLFSISSLLWTTFSVWNIFIYLPITYYWTVPLILDHSYLLGEVKMFKNCWYKRVRILKSLKLFFQQFLYLSSSQRDTSGPILGDLSSNRWSGVVRNSLLEEEDFSHDLDLCSFNTTEKRNSNFVLLHYSKIWILIKQLKPDKNARNLVSSNRAEVWNAIFDTVFVWVNFTQA